MNKKATILGLFFYYPFVEARDGNEIYQFWDQYFLFFFINFLIFKFQ